MGSFVGAAFASGKIDDLHQVALDLDWKRLLYYFSGLSSPRTGLIDGTRAVKLVTQNVEPTDIADLALPFAAVATDILTGDEVVLKKGNVIDAIRASIAIPGLFTPLSHNQRVLVDGGLVNPLPIGVARQLGADRVIAVDITRSPLPTRAERNHAARAGHEAHALSSLRAHSNGVRDALDRLNAKLRGAPPTDQSAAKADQRGDVPNIFEIFGNSMRIIQRQITDVRLQLDPPDLLIQPNVQHIRTMDFHRAADAIESGYDAASESLDSGILRT